MKKQYIVSHIDKDRTRIVLYIDGKLTRGFTEDRIFVEGFIRGLKMEGWTQGYTKEMIDETEKEISDLTEEIATLQRQLYMLELSLETKKENMICEK